ncbi:hypothetical protein [Alteribacillus sp. YIM 98480]|uniref:hypothetical protein n=1 Tax=Alteribacillus sp. YIM 98480 TaxID=2606599 RepID=UPI00131D3985|nr:hypothetical protein [Alteribacillus sp. YIM 98480]
MTQTYLGITSFLAVVIYLVSVFFPSQILTSIYSSIALLLLLFALKKMNGANRFVVLLLLISGSILFLFYNVSFLEALFSFGENLNLLGLFLLIPLFGVLMSEAGYLQALQTALRKREKSRQAHPYRLGYILTAFMGSLLNLGSMPLVYKIGSESFSSFENKKFGLTLLRGFGFCMLWSPYFVNVGLVLILYDLTWQEVGGYGFLIAVVYTILVAVFYPFITFSKEEYIRNDSTSKNNFYYATSPLKGLSFYIIILLFLSVAIEIVLPVNMLTVVSLLALVYPLVWSVSIGMVQGYFQAALHHISHSFERLNNEIGIFITAGFFGEALARSNAGNLLADAILWVSKGIIPLLILILIISVMFLAFIGVHPVIIVSGLGSSLTPEQFGVPPAFMGILLLCAWTLSTQMSPFSGSILMGAHLMKERPWNIVKKNAAFVFTALIVFTLLLTVFEWIQAR